MCTVSIVPLADGFRVMCNRDEQRARPVALPPRWVDVGGAAAIMPTDPLGGGSWIAVTRTGLAIAMLNRLSAAAPAAGRPLLSRGGIVTSLAPAADLDDCLAAIRRLHPARYRPFRIVAVHGKQIVAATSDGATIAIARSPLLRPVLFTSSSLGDTAAERMRFPLFEALVVQAADPLPGQRAFHAHRWPRCAAFSVVMCRDDARTVSRSTIEVRAGLRTFAYEPLPQEMSCSPSPRH